MVIGAHASLGMLKRARKRLDSQSHFSGIYLLRTNLLRSPFLPAVFDVVLSLHVAHVVEGNSRRCWQKCVGFSNQAEDYS